MKIGRNELCYCGSGKKYKKCCMEKDMNMEVSNYPLKENKREEKEIDYEEMIDFLNNFHNLLLEKKPHIKEYKKIRTLHSEILDSMIQYFESGKFKLVIKNEMSNSNIDNGLIESHFDSNTDLGFEGLMDIIIYKHSNEMNCITEEYINKNKFRKPEKIEFLNSMLNSISGLFEIVRTERELGYVYLKEVFSKKEICITDMSLSNSFSTEKIYIYTRIITYNGISFGTGFNLMFDKHDKFIKKWIKENEKNYDEKQELGRFMELYNEYKRDNKGVVGKINNKY